MMMMAQSSQTRIVGRVDGQFLHARRWLDVHAQQLFGQTKVWTEDDRDAARSFCLLRFSFAASCLELTTGFSH